MCAMMDSGDTRLLLHSHMLPRGARAFDVAINLASGKVLIAEPTLTAHALSAH